MEQLGIEPSLLLAQIVNFTIIIFVLTKLLYKPIIGLLDKRKQEIAEGLALTEKMRQEEERMKEKQQKITEKARSDARKIIEDAKKEAELEGKRIIAEAHTEAGNVLERAKSESVKQYDEMVKKVRKQAVDLAVAMTKRLTASVLSDKEQHKLVAQHMKDLQNVNTGR